VVAGCLIDVLVTVHVDAMQRIFAFEDFPTGVRQAAMAMPELAGDLEPRLAVCFNPRLPTTPRPATP
jgi:hypothetical protein